MSTTFISQLLTIIRLIGFGLNVDGIVDLHVRYFPVSWCSPVYHLEPQDGRIFRYLEVEVAVLMAGGIGMGIGIGKFSA